MDPWLKPALLIGCFAVSMMLCCWLVQLLGVPTMIWKHYVKHEELPTGLSDAERDELRDKDFLENMPVKQASLAGWIVLYLLIWPSMLSTRIEHRIIATRLRNKPRRVDR